MKDDLIQWHDAAMEARATLYLMLERLEVNDYEGEEAPFMEDCQNAIAMIDALPINEDAVHEYRKNKENQHAEIYRNRHP
jgi:hypothetical protein